MKYDDIPVYELELDDALGVFAIALVKNPAMKAKWQAFASQEEPVRFAVQDEAEHKVLAVLARADFPIFRKDRDGNPYYVIFRKDTIEELVRRLLRNNYENIINVEHRDEWRVDGVEMTQVFIKDSEKGIAPKAFPDIEEHSAFCEYKISNPEVWQAVLDGVFEGVSLEGYFDIRQKPATTIDELLKQRS